MWNKITGKNDNFKDPNEERKTRSKRGNESNASIVSSTSTRKPNRTTTSESESRRASIRNPYPPASPLPQSAASSYATAYTTGNDDLYDDPREERGVGRREERGWKSEIGGGRDERRRDREDRDSRSEAGRVRADSNKGRKEKKSSSSSAGGSRRERSSSVTQPTYRGEIVDSPRGERSVYGDIPTGGHMMSGALPTPPAGSRPPLSSHVNDQFPTQNPAQFAAPYRPGIGHSDSFGAASEYYGDVGQSVHEQPGVRPQQPSVIMPLDTPHLTAASSTANPVADTGAGAAAEFYGPNNFTSTSAMPGAFTDDGPGPPKPPRPSSEPSGSSKPSKPGQIGSTGILASGAALGYAMGHQTSTHQSTSYTNATQGASASTYYHGDTASIGVTEGSQIPTYSEVMEFEDAPPPMPPRPGKPEKQPSGSSNAPLYAAGAAGLVGYGLHNHNLHNHSSHNHSNSMPGAFPGGHNAGFGSSSGPFLSGGMAQRYENKGPVGHLVNWWKDHEDVQKMEEYTELIGVCRGCFDPRSSVNDAPRKHHYNRKRSGEFARPSGVEKQSRYGLSEKSSRHSLSSDEKHKLKRKSSSSSNTNRTSWLAAGLGSVGLASAGKALWNNQRDDFDDTYSIKSGRHAHSRVSRQSRNRSRDHRRYTSDHSERHHRNRSHDRASQMSIGVTNDLKDHKFVRRHSLSRSRSRSRSRDRKSSGSGLLGTAIGVGLAASAVGASRRKHRSRSRSRSYSPAKVSVHHRRDSSDYDRRHSASKPLRYKSSRSSAGSVIDISHKPQPQTGGILGGFFAPPPPKVKRRTSHSRPKKKKGFFNFGNSSSSSSDGLIFGEAYVKKRAKPKSRRNSDEKFKANILALGAAAGALAAAKARNNSKRPEVVAVRESRNGRRLDDRRRGGASSRYADDEADEWEDVLDDDSSDSGSVSSGLAFGDYNWKNGKSQESLASNDSGTSKWFWRWGNRDKKKKKSTENLHNAGSSSSLIGPVVTGTAAGALIGAGLSRHDSSASSAHTLHSVYPIQTSDVAAFDARPMSTSTNATSQPYVNPRSDGNNMYQPQPVYHIPGSMYATQGPPPPSYVTPEGPPVFSQSLYSPTSQPPSKSHSQSNYPAQFPVGILQSPKR
ncbi:hypothetical protein K504DRAFT_221552 [Pleomassaria siparia CBS 279.74]|uniref:Uncharacterized protein n=1 Tax=Pleomassaria siparia CBS 279.74 TaxID=1314801 RepID=A0A6G1KGF3_9PLEO|nr:hypothetical protein K504DRAFT_221552 [Pleomassaria siparia CBS 279.74]